MVLDRLYCDCVESRLCTSHKQGFPLGIVEAHSYGYELSGLYALVFAYFTAAGPGRLSIGSAEQDE